MTSQRPDDDELAAAWDEGYEVGYEDGSEDTWNACHDT